MNKKNLFLCLLALVILSACSTTKFVPEGKYLLNRVSIETDNKKVQGSSLDPYLKQHPNTTTLGLIKIPLKIYSLSGKDSTKWINQKLRKSGTPPVIYDTSLTQASVKEIEKALYNKGYMDATAWVDSTIKGKRISLTYHVKTGKPYIIRNFSYNCEDTSLVSLIKKREKKMEQLTGENFDLDLLNEERERITTVARNSGRYYFDKEFITYTADSTISNHQIDVVMNIQTPTSLQENMKEKAFKISYINQVYIHILPNTNTGDSVRPPTDTFLYKGIHIISAGTPWMHGETLVNASIIRPGIHYSDRLAEWTYTSFARFPIIRFTTINYEPLERLDSSLIDCHIYIAEGKAFSVNAELMGTNTGGDLGVALSVGFQHKNLFNRGIAFDFKLHGSYENASITSGDYKYRYYYEYGGETSLTFSKLLIPFIQRTGRRFYRGTSTLSAEHNYQIRPEYKRIHTAFSWIYKIPSSPYTQHTIDIPTLSFVNVKDMSPDFTQYLLEKSVSMLYGFQSHFIFGVGYQFSHTNQRRGQTKVYSYNIRASVETSGNLLYCVSSLSNQKKNGDGFYEIFDLPYSQYIRGNFKFSNAIQLGKSHSIHFCVSAGVAYPYGNSNYIPFEKQFSAGGANNVRGWSIRTLGPGHYKAENLTENGNYIYELGDLSLFGSFEHRAKLFWKIESALFFDIGNIWSINEAQAPEGGMFHFNSFYKELAMAYGLGVRLNFDFFVLRLDLGLKLYNPEGEGKWMKPFVKNGTTLNLAIGYPF